MKTKDYKTYLICDLVIIIFKLLIGLFGYSITLITTAVFDFIVNITSLLALRGKEENSKKKSIVSSIYGFIMILISMFIIYMTFNMKPMKPSLLVLLPLIFFVVSNYIITVINTNKSLSKKEGILGISNKNSSTNMILYIIVAITIILSKFTKFFKFFKYSDRVGVIIVSLLIAFLGVRILVRSFRHMEDDEEEIKKIINEEINKQKEVKNVTGVDIFSLGGIKRINIGLKLQDKFKLSELITFVVTLEDFLLKYADYASVTLVKNVSRKGVRASTKKTTKKGAKSNAGNSRSTNSKKSTKKKSTKKKNKKR